MAIPQYLEVTENIDYKVGNRIAGGSGGSIFQAIATADELKSRCGGNSDVVVKKLQCKLLIQLKIVSAN